ncbi:MAG: hypothetical protein KDA75_19815, partial [Planctomycetaceae bacterium]|nr:hypothetical protein [Planctomycetaceae bacterium]
ANPGDETSTQLHARIYHDEDAELYLNGKRVAVLTGYVTNYREVLLPDGAVQAGENVLAVHCHQTDGGQYIDVGLIGLTPRKPAP